MVKVLFDLNKTIEENAGIYFDKAKKAKKKKENATIALTKSNLQLLKIQKNKPIEEKIVIHKKKKEWFEKYRWFYSSEGFLVIGGRDSTTNEIIIKKHTDSDDIVFHTDMAGSPFFVIKVNSMPKIKPGKITIQETANATAIYSRAWKKGLANIDVFYVKPNQVTKQAKSGESLPKGAFMIYGKTNYVTPLMEAAIGIKDDILIGGPSKSIENNSEKWVKLIQGDKKPSDCAKIIRKILGGGDIDEIIRFLPPGFCNIVK